MRTLSGGQGMAYVTANKGPVSTLVAQEQIIAPEDTHVVSGGAIRRVIDLIGALTLGIVALPIVLVVAGISFAVYRAWPMFSHERVGLSGKDFKVHKVRTLPLTTARYAEKGDLAAQPVPRIMRLVRAMHVDELPQLWNVINGSMTFIGPRPEMRFLHERLPYTFARDRVSTRPGLTGLWQISHGSRVLIADNPQYDVFYLENRTFRLDVWIAYRTVVKMITDKTVALDDVPAWALRSTAAEEHSVVI